METQKLKIGFLLFPNLTQLDFTGPYEVFSRLEEVEVFTVAKVRGPVRSEFGLTFIADHDFGTTPQLDLICVPGGGGTLDASVDGETLLFLRRQAEKAQWITSVCTGALLLGAAGLLKGYKATTHWLSLDLLEHVGAIPISERVVKDRNRITGGGITAGIDFGLYLVAELFGQNRAQQIQLMMEYNPHPPFQCGHPSVAPTKLVAEVAHACQALQEKRRKFYANLSTGNL